MTTSSRSALGTLRDAGEPRNDAGEVCVPAFDPGCPCDGFATQRVTPQRFPLFGGGDAVSNGQHIAFVGSSGGDPAVAFVEIDPRGTKLGNDSTLSDDGASALWPSLALNGSEYGVIWTQTDLGEAPGAYFAKVDESGTMTRRVVLDPEGGRDGRQSGLDLIATGRGYAALHAGPDGQVSLLWLDTDGAIEATPVEVVPPGITSTDFSMTWNGSETAIVWRDFRSGDYEIYFARFRPGEAGPVTANVQISDALGISSRPAVAFDGSRYAIAWEDNRAGNYDLYYMLLDADGAKLTNELNVDSAPDDSLSPRLLFTGTEFLIAWATLTSDTPQRTFLAFSTFDASSGALAAPETVPEPVNNFLMWQPLIHEGRLMLWYEEAEYPWLALLARCEQGFR
jgi:hypothetical protein